MPDDDGYEAGYIRVYCDRCGKLMWKILVDVGLVKTFMPRRSRHEDCKLEKETNERKYDFSNI